MVEANEEEKNYSRVVREESTKWMEKQLDTYLGHFNLKILLNLFNLKSLSYQN